jgi:CheY-like chemotaxis protein
MDPGPFDDRAECEPGGRRPRGHLVVVDPSPVSLLALAGVLHSGGYEVTCARTTDAAQQALQSACDGLIWDVGNDAPSAWSAVEAIRKDQAHRDLPAVLLADAQWAGLEKRVEQLERDAHGAGPPTRCLFKPLDPKALLAVVDQVLWLPSLVANHRRRGSRPSRPGWIRL